MANSVTNSRKVPGSAPPQPSTTATTIASAETAYPTKLVEMWTCDCCKIARFEELADACAHEKECLVITAQEKLKRTREAPEIPVPAVTAAAPTTKATATVATFFQKGTKRKVVPAANENGSHNSAVIEIPSRVKKSKRKSGSSNSSGIGIGSDSERPSRKAKTEAKAKQKVIELLDSPSPVKTVEKKKNTRKKTKVIELGLVVDEVPPPTKRKAVLASAASAASAVPKSKKKTKAATAAAKSDWASLFSGKQGGDASQDKALMAEAVAAEFQAKRRLEQQRQRERQKKRQEQQQATAKSASDGLQAVSLSAAPKGSATATSTDDVSRSSSTAVQRPLQSSSSLLAAPRFPNPSHIIPASGCDSLTATDTGDLAKAHGSWLTPADLERARLALQTTTSSPTTVSLFSDYLAMLPQPNSYFATEAVERDALQEALSTILVPPVILSTDTSTVVAPQVVSLDADFFIGDKKSAKSTSLWADKYAIRNIPDDICGSSLRNVADQLTEFCQEWMVKRHKAHERMASRQRALAEKAHRLHKKNASQKKKPQRYRDDDDFMDSEGEEEWQLGSLCVLTGPIGSGKSSLVHAVAAKCGCTVLEITTADKRGNAAIRRAMEEATQSLSSMEMLKQRETSLFGTKELVDSDDEQETTTAKGSSVTIVLIDEVDNLYDANGDSGFWTALSELSKRAKCPIFLTANVLPAALYSSSFRYTHVETSCPSPKECVPKMLQIADTEGFSIRKSQEHAKEKHFELIAELCNCDLRRIAHELQLFSRAPKQSIDRVETKVGAILEEGTERENEDNRPRISEVRPGSIPSDSMSLLTINGAHFMTLAVPPGLGSTGYPVTIFVGDQECPQARIMDDSTILAVCPPCRLAGDINKWGNYQGTHQRSLAVSYSPISIYGNNKMGIGSTTRGAVFSTELPDGSKVASLDTPTVLEYHFQPSFSSHEELHGKSETNSGDESEEEEFQDTDTGPQSSKSTINLSVLDNKPAPEVDWKLMAHILKDGIDAWASKDNAVAQTEIKMSDDSHGGEVLDALASQRELASDAALFEEYGLVGIPYLSGACRGFGFDLTEAFPKSNNIKSKP